MKRDSARFTIFARIYLDRVKSFTMAFNGKIFKSCRSVLTEEETFFQSSRHASKKKLGIKLLSGHSFSWRIISQLLLPNLYIIAHICLRLQIDSKVFNSYIDEVLFNVRCTIEEKSLSIFFLLLHVASFYIIIIF